MALPSGTDVEVIGMGNSTGATLGASTSELISFYGVAPTLQLSASAQATTAASWVTICGAKAAFGTSDDAVTLLNTIKNIQHVLKTTGLWKGSA